MSGRFTLDYVCCDAYYLNRVMNDLKQIARHSIIMSLSSKYLDTGVFGTDVCCATPLVLGGVCMNCKRGKIQESARVQMLFDTSDAKEYNNDSVWRRNKSEKKTDNRVYIHGERPPRMVRNSA